MLALFRNKLTLNVKANFGRAFLTRFCASIPYLCIVTFFFIKYIFLLKHILHEAIARKSGSEVQILELAFSHVKVTLGRRKKKHEVQKYR